MLDKKQRRKYLQETTLSTGEQLDNLRIQSGLSVKEFEETYLLKGIDFKHGVPTIQLQLLAYIAAIYNKKLEIKFIDIE